jgi:hypothetical protein
VYQRTSHPILFKWIASPVKRLKWPSAGKLANSTFVSGLSLHIALFVSADKDFIIIRFSSDRMDKIKNNYEVMGGLRLEVGSVMLEVV